MKTTQLNHLTKFIYVFCAMSLLLNATGCVAMSSMYDAQVLDKDGIPCFSVNEGHLKDAPKLASINVLDVSQRWSRLMWEQFSIELDRIPIVFSPSFCLLYGAPLENTGEFSKPKKLEIGIPYEAYISADVKQGKDLESRRYVVHFCLARTKDDIIKVHQVIYNKGWRYEVCKP